MHKSQTGRRGWSGASIFVLMIAATLTSGVAADEPTGLSQAAKEAIGQLDSKDAYTRKIAFMRLEALREPASADAIRPYAENKDEVIRADSLRALAAIQGIEAVPFLLKKWETEKRARVRWSILLALEPLRQQQPALLHTFIDGLDDYSTEVRMAALDIVSRINDDAARTAILTRFKKELHPDARRVLKTAMQRMELNPADTAAAAQSAQPDSPPES